MESFGKMIFLLGVFLVLMGLGMMFFGKSIPFWKLPGDIIIKKEGMQIYFPVMTCLLLSFFLTLLFSFWKR